MAEKNDNQIQPRRLYWLVSFFGKRFKNLWWLQLSFLFLLLLGGGFYAFITMGDVAHKLVGGDNYNDMSEHSRIYGSAVLSSERNIFFTSEESLFNDSADNKSSLSSSDFFKGKGAVGASSGDAGVSEKNFNKNSEEGDSGNVKSSLARGHFSNSLERRLPIKKSNIFSGKGSDSKTSGAFSGSNKSVVSSKEVKQKSAKGGETGANNKTSAMQALKKTWKMGIYGARDASKDAAKNWIARAFDNSVSSEYSLEYDEKMKRQLDIIDPKSIPDYLRDTDVNQSSAKSLGIKDVGAPELDKDGTKKALDSDVKYQAAKLANDASKGMLNSLFGGMDFGGDQSPAYQDIGGDAMALEDIDEVNTMSDPNEPPQLNDSEIMDIGGGCGEECGCSCATPCCCLPPDYFNNVGDFPAQDPNIMYV
ncbi:MAG: hypothetical protein L6420_05850 [Elusimicrobia bacterium]|nr:hypothetical protein [Elusimicrobiota bacterium]